RVGGAHLDGAHGGDGAGAELHAGDGDRAADGGDADRGGLAGGAGDTRGRGARAAVHQVRPGGGGDRVAERVAGLGLDGDGLAEGESDRVGALPHHRPIRVGPALFDVEGDVVDDVAPAVRVVERGDEAEGHDGAPAVRSVG